jgi:hypothetical protein
MNPGIAEASQNKVVRCYSQQRLVAKGGKRYHHLNQECLENEEYV